MTPGQNIAPLFEAEGKRLAKSFSLVGAAIEGGTAGGLPGALIAVGGELLQMTEGFGRIQSTFNNVIGDLVMAIDPVVSVLADALEPILVAIGSVFKSLKPAFESLANILQSTIVPIFETLGFALEVIGTVIGKLFSGITGIIGSIFGLQKNIEAESERVRQRGAEQNLIDTGEAVSREEARAIIAGEGAGGGISKADAQDIVGGLKTAPEDTGEAVAKELTRADRIGIPLLPTINTDTQRSRIAASKIRRSEDDGGNRFARGDRVGSRDTLNNPISERASGGLRVSNLTGGARDIFADIFRPINNLSALSQLVPINEAIRDNTASLLNLQMRGTNVLPTAPNLQSVVGNRQGGVDFDDAGGVGGGGGQRPIVINGDLNFNVEQVADIEDVNDLRRMIEDDEDVDLRGDAIVFPPNKG